MNSKTNSEKLAKVEENQARMSEKLDAQNEKLDYLVDRFDKFMDKYESDKEGMFKKFITRAEAIAVAAVISIAITALTLWINVSNHWK